MLELLGYRSDKCVTDKAIEAGIGVPRWNDFTMQNDWHLDRVLAAIRSAAQEPEKLAVADTLTKAIAKEEDRRYVAARKREQAEMDAAHRQEEEAELLGLEIELRMLRTYDPGMSLLNAVEFISPDPAHRIALCRRSIADGRSTLSGHMDQDDPDGLTVDSAVAKDLGLLRPRSG
jgi:hypothetical protein